MPQLKGKSGSRRVEAISNCYKVEGHLEVMEATVEKQFDPVPCQRPSETTTGQNLLEKKSDLFFYNTLIDTQGNSFEKIMTGPHPSPPPPIYTTLH